MKTIQLLSNGYFIVEGTPVLEKVVDEEFEKKFNQYIRMINLCDPGSSSQKMFEQLLTVLLALEMPKYNVTGATFTKMKWYQVWWMHMCKFFNCNWYE